MHARLMQCEGVVILRELRTKVNQFVHGVDKGLGVGVVFPEQLQLPGHGIGFLNWPGGAKTM